MTPRQAIHKLVDEIPEAELQAAQRFLEFLKEHDPVLAAFRQAEALGTEKPTKKELEIIRKGLEDFDNGRFVTLEEAERRLLGKKRPSKIGAKPLRGKKPASKKASTRG